MQSKDFNPEIWDKPHILITDDDARIRTLLSRYLSEHDYVVTTAEDAEDAREKIKDFHFDLMIFDIMMPGTTGLELTHELKEQNHQTPIILLTALGETQNRIEGFEAGADDYLPKPFEPKEILLRIQAILRRQAQAAPKRLKTQQLGPWTFDAERLTLQDGDAQISLTAAEGNLLSNLLQKAGQIVTRDSLCQQLGISSTERTIDVQITRLRKKIEPSPKTPKYLLTIRGKGYLLKPEN